LFWPSYYAYKSLVRLCSYTFVLPETGECREKERKKEERERENEYKLVILSSSFPQPPLSEFEYVGGTKKKLTGALLQWSTEGDPPF
jgi:hypothetical protein